MTTVTHIPRPQALEYIFSMANQMEFPADRENELEFILFFRKGPYLKYVYTESNDAAWLRFRPLTDGEHILYLSYRKVELRNSNHRQIYVESLSSFEREKRHWVVEQILHLLDNPTQAQEFVRKTAALQKQQKMLRTTLEEAITMKVKSIGAVLNLFNIEHTNKTSIRVHIQYQSSSFEFQFSSDLAAEFIEELPEIIHDYIGLKKNKRGRIDHYNYKTDNQWITA